MRATDDRSHRPQQEVRYQGRGRSLVLHHSAGPRHRFPSARTGRANRRRCALFPASTTLERLCHHQRQALCRSGQSVADGGCAPGGQISAQWPQRAQPPAVPGPDAGPAGQPGRCDAGPGRPARSRNQARRRLLARDGPAAERRCCPPRRSASTPAGRAGQRPRPRGRAVDQEPDEAASQPGQDRAGVLRHTAGAISTVIGIVLVVPILASLLPTTGARTSTPISRSKPDL